MDIVEILDRYSAGDEFQRPVEAAIEEIEQLRQRVAEQLETIKALNSCIGGEGSTTTENLIRVSRLEQRVAELEKERDKANQYWQIAEGRCDALMKQRDELLAAAVMAVEMIEYEKHERRHVRWKLNDAIASVKEK